MVCFVCLFVLQKQINSFTWAKSGLDNRTSSWAVPLSGKWPFETEMQFCPSKYPSFWCQNSHFKQQQQKTTPISVTSSWAYSLDQGRKHALTAICAHQKRQAAFRLFSASEQQAGKPLTWGLYDHMRLHTPFLCFLLWACCDGMLKHFSRACSAIQPCTHN